MCNSIENIMKDLIIDFCYPMLKTNNISYVNIFHNSIKISCICLLFVIICYIFFKKLNIVSFFKEYKKQFKHLCIIYILNYVCFFILDNINLDISNKKEIFQINTLFGCIELLIFTIFIIFLIIKQISEWLEFLLTIIISPLYVFNYKYDILKNRLFKLILSNFYIALSFFIILKLNINPIFLLLIMYLIINNEKFFLEIIKINDNSYI